MKTSTSTLKGQVTEPKEFRDAFGCKAGDELAFAYEEGLARLRGAPWNPKLTTDELMKMTRGEPD